MDVYLIRTSTGQYKGQVYATRELAEKALLIGVEARKLLGVNLGVLIIKVKVIEE